MSDTTTTEQPPQAGVAGAGPAAGAQPDDEELRAAYEAELNRITSADLILQTAASLLNLGAHRLGLVGTAAAGGSERDLEQVRDAIDGVRGLMPILERRAPEGLRELRDALAQLQMAYAREAPRASADTAPGPADAQPVEQTGQQTEAPQAAQPSAQQPQPRRPGPAEASGRLWVPGAEPHGR